MEQSDYMRRGYASLHIKAETRQRLNLVKAQIQASNGQFITQDDLLNHLLNQFAVSSVAEGLPNEQPYSN